MNIVLIYSEVNTLTIHRDVNVCVTNIMLAAHRVKSH